MFMWDKSTPKTLSASPTNQLKVSLGMRAATLRTIEVSVKSSRWTSPDIGMITVRGKRSEGIVVSVTNAETPHSDSTSLQRDS